MSKKFLIFFPLYLSQMDSMKTAMCPILALYPNAECLAKKQLVPNQQLKPIKPVKL